MHIILWRGSRACWAPWQAGGRSLLSPHTHMTHAPHTHGQYSQPPNVRLSRLSECVYGREGFNCMWTGLFYQANDAGSAGPVATAATYHHTSSPSSICCHNQGEGFSSRDSSVVTALGLLILPLDLSSLWSTMFVSTWSASMLVLSLTTHGQGVGVGGTNWKSCGPVDLSYGRQVRLDQLQETTACVCA